MRCSRRLFVVGAVVFTILGAGAGVAFAEEEESSLPREQIGPPGDRSEVAFAEEEESSLPRPDFGVDIAFVNMYVWRGLVLTDGPVFEPSATLGYKGASINVWGNLDLNNVNDTSGDFNEVDLTLDYTHSIEEISLSAGLIYYDFPNTEFRSTLELYAGAGLDILLQPTITVYFDVDQVEGIYGTLGFSHSFSLPGSDAVSWSLDLATNVGLGSSKYVNYYFGVDNAAFTNFYAEASLPVILWDTVTVTPYLGVSVVLDNALRAAVDESDNFIGGGILSWSI